MSFTVYPALDIRNGAVVRLVQGDYNQQTTYGDDVLPRAQAFADAGAAWMHLVDLDAAKAGGYTLSQTLEAINQQTGLKIQTGGGAGVELGFHALNGFVDGAHGYVLFIVKNMRSLIAFEMEPIAR